MIWILNFLAWPYRFLGFFFFFFFFFGLFFLVHLDGVISIIPFLSSLFSLSLPFRCDPIHRGFFVVVCFVLIWTIVLFSICFIPTSSSSLLGLSIFAFVSSAFIIAYWSIFVMAAFKCVQQNSNIFASSVNLSNDIYWLYTYIFSFSLKTSLFLAWQGATDWNLIFLCYMFWYDKGLLMEIWILSCYMYLRIIFKSFVLTLSDPLCQGKGWYTISLPTGRGRTPGSPLIFHLTWDRGCSYLTLSNGGHSSFPCGFQWHCLKEGGLFNTECGNRPYSSHLTSPHCGGRAGLLLPDRWWSSLFMHAP